MFALPVPIVLGIVVLYAFSSIDILKESFSQPAAKEPAGE
jgi:hypothetical protein